MVGWFLVRQLAQHPSLGNENFFFRLHISFSLNLLSIPNLVSISSNKYSMYVC